MLRSLHVKNFAVIDEVEIEFEKGLNILTGETGAGKSILINSINAALGAKVSKDVIRRGRDYAMVELVFEVTGEEALKRLEELDLSVDDNEVIITRKIMDNGKSVVKFNGETTTVSVIRKAASLLLDIHGQNENHSLLDKARHLELVDRFGEGITLKSGDLKAVKEKVSEASKKCSEIEKELKELELDPAARAREISFLEFAVKEIRDAALSEGEDDELKARHRKLASASRISESLSVVKKLMCDGGVSDMIARSIRELESVKDLDEELQTLTGSLYDGESLVSDFTRELAAYIDGMEDSEEELREVESRIDLINGLKNKYGSTIGEIKKYAEKSEDRLEILSDCEERAARLESELSKARLDYERAAGQLTKLREEAAEVLSKSIISEMSELNFSHIDFKVEFTENEGYRPNGCDECEFLISLNVGEGLKPLTKVASGGELSRIMLAVKTVFADIDDVDAMIFDEIDAGISGRTAQKVAEKMWKIGKMRQVIAITHLPQIAGMADHHYVIEKSSDEFTTQTDIRTLGEDEVSGELARMLGGARITDSVMENARELKALADEMKK